MHQAQPRGTVSGRHPKRIEKLPQQARWPDRSNRSHATVCEQSATLCNFGKLNLEKDTSLKPCGLDSGGPKSGLYVPDLSQFCPACVPAHFALGRAHGRRASRCCERRRCEKGRSRLEPYGEFVDELRCQGFTCRDIAALLAETCQVQTSKSAVSRLVRARARRRRKAARQISRSIAIPTPVVPKAGPLQAGHVPSDD